MHTLLTGRVRAREGRQRTTTELSSTRGQNVYKRGGTRTFPQSPLSQHRQQSLRHVAVSYPGGGRIKDLRNRTRDGASYLWRLDPSQSQCKEGGNTEHMRRRHSSRNEAGLTEVNFGRGFIKTSYHGTLPIMEHLVSVDSHLVLYSVILLVVCVLSFV